jgi:hypothetical protein
MYILIEGQKFDWHMYFLTDQLDYTGLFKYIHIVKLYNLNQNDLQCLLDWTFY